MLERFKVPEQDRVYVRQEKMRAATKDVFRRMGLTEDDAALAADVLIANDLRGVETHGVSNMLRSYVADYTNGELNPRPSVRIERETHTTAVMNGDGALGLHIAPRAMDMAVEKAAEHGLGAVGVHNVGHMGGCGYHAMRAVERDMIGVALTTSGGRIGTVPTFGAEPVLGTHPIAYAAPANKMPPFLFDVGTTQIANNKLRLAERVGAKIAPGWITRPDGTPIMEEVVLPKEYYLLPFGGTREMGSHKGYGFGCVVDILGSTLTGLGPGLIARTPGYHLMAYDIEAFVDVDKFKADMDSFLEALANTPPAPGHDRVYYAGLQEAEDMERRLKEGIPYHREVIAWFHSIEPELGLEFDFGPESNTPLG